MEPCLGYDLYRNRRHSSTTVQSRSDTLNGRYEGKSLDYPATFDFNAPPKIDRWRVIGNSILSIPHLVVLSVLGATDSVVTIFSWIAIVFTGRLPEGLANFNCMMIRHTIRVATFTSFLRNSYPPFDFDATVTDDGGDPEVLVSFHPQLEDRSRASVFFRIILLIPVAVMSVVWSFVVGIVGFIGAFAVLIMGRRPTGMLNVIVGVNRYHVRTLAYANLLTDRYPPLELR